MVRSHCKIHHDKREAPSVAMQKEISQDPSSTRLKTSSSAKYTQPPRQKPANGLEVLQGYLCPLSDSDGVCCSKAFLAMSSFVRHLSGHNVRPRPDPASCASPVQTLFAQGGLQMYFSVDVSLSMPDPPLSSVYTDVLPLLRSLPVPRIQVASNDKERASIHWFTRWPELLGPYCEEDERVCMLRSLVSFPDSGVDPDWLLKVKDHGCRWWAKAESAHVNCSYRASVLLKSHQEYVSPVLSRLSPLTSSLGTVVHGKSCARMTVLGGTAVLLFRWYLSASELWTSPPTKFQLDLPMHRGTCSKNTGTTLRLPGTRRTSM